MNRFLPATALLALAACAAGPRPEPEVRIQEVYVEKPVTCVPGNLGEAPTYPDSDDALRRAADAAERYALLWAGRLLRAARLGEVEPVVTECRNAAK